MLRDANLKEVYRSEDDNLLLDFYIPALRSSQLYQRAVGFFSASMLSFAAQGLSALVKSGGRMELIVGYELSEQDARAIEEGYELRELNDRIGTEFVEIIGAVDDGLFANRLETLSWMIAGGSLDVKVALRRKGMYHEKIGVFYDADGDSVVFEGSANETANALLPDFNFESISVYPSWRPELAGFYKPYKDGFDRLWNNQSPKTKVIEFPEAIRDKLVRIGKSVRTPPDPEIEKSIAAFFSGDDSRGEDLVGEPTIPTVLGGKQYELRKHQLSAIRKWKNDGYRGIFALATGAGKTITAIHSACLVFQALKAHKGKLCLVVSVPYINLGDQWIETLRLFNIQGVPCYGTRTSWEPTLRESISALNMGARDFVCAVVVNATLRGDAFQSILGEIPDRNLMLVGDECHHYGSMGLASALPENAEYRIGLSATPEHYLDDDATARVVNYFGRIVSEYGLKEALEDDVLSPYRYYVEPIELTEDEAEQYRSLTKEIGILMLQGNNPKGRSRGSEEKLGRLLRERARLIGAAQNKLPALIRLLSAQRPEPLTLFYCGDGTVDDEELPGALKRQIDAVIEKLGQLKWKSSRFTAREGKRDREEILNAFKIASIDALVAIRCLDEGIDIPSCRKAYILASSRNPRQFIQRRGRILRKAPGKDYAEIYDFMVILPSSDDEYEGDRKLVKAELERVAEFANLAQNPSDSYVSLQPILEAYDLEHLIV